MKAHTASLMSAIALIALGLWAYVDSESPSLTALIPVAVGVILLVLNNGVKRENKVIAHIAVVLTILIALALFMPFNAALGRKEMLPIVRIGIMIAFSFSSLFYFIKSFRDARSARER